MARDRITARLGIAKTAAAKKKEKDQPEAVRNLSGFDYDPSKAKNLKRSLHNMNVALGTLLAAMKDLSLMRGSEVTPDGMLGGRGFVMPFKEIKARLNEAVGHLSDITDTIADELTNPKWKLSRQEITDVRDLKEDIDETVDEAEDTIEDLEAAKRKKTPKEPNRRVPATKDQDKEIRERLEQQAGEAPPEIQEIGPEMVQDSTEVLAMKKYKDLLEGSGADKVASALSKNIMANLSKGDK